MIRFLLDEHLRGPIFNAIRNHNTSGVNILDAVRVGDIPELPLGSKDPVILAWAVEQDRILISEDVNTMGSHLSSHLNSGHSSPGILMLRATATYPEIIDFLILIAYASDPQEWRDRIVYIPSSV